MEIIVDWALSAKSRFIFVLGYTDSSFLKSPCQYCPFALPF